MHILSFFTHPAPTEIYTLSLHDALPILHRDDHHAGERRRHRCARTRAARAHPRLRRGRVALELAADLAALLPERDRKSTRLNSSHMSISYAVFCLKKKNNKKNSEPT